MAYCCFSARCRPPDSDRCGTARHNSLSVRKASSDVVGVNACGRKKEINVLPLPTRSKSTSDEDVSKHERSLLASWKNVSMFSERDKQAIKSQLSIWFPRIFTCPCCETVREIKANVAQSLSSIAVVKRNKHLSESKRQRIYHRRNCRNQEFNSMKSYSKKNTDPRRLTLENVKPPKSISFDSESESDRGYVDNDLCQSLGKSVDTKEHFILSEGDIQNEMNLKKIPEWFLTFIEAQPVLDINLLNIDQLDRQPQLKLPRRLEMMRMSTSEASRKNGIFYVSVKEMVYDRADAAIFVEESLSSQNVYIPTQNSYSNDRQKLTNGIIQPVKSSSDQFVSSYSMRHKDDSFKGIFPKERKKFFRCNWKPQKNKRNPLSKRITPSHQSYCSQTPEQAGMYSYHTDSLSSGDFSLTEISSWHSTISERETVLTVKQKKKYYEDHTDRTNAADLQDQKNMANKKQNMAQNLDIPCTLLNISNSSSNGVNRTQCYSRDHFSGNPKTKVSNVKRSTSKDSGKDEMRVSKERPASKSPRKKSGSPDSRRPIFSSYEIKYGKESSDEDSRSGNTMVELSMHKTKKSAKKMNPDLSVTSDNFVMGEDIHSPHANIQAQAHTRRYIEKPQTTQEQERYQVSVKEEARVEGSKKPNPEKDRIISKCMQPRPPISHNASHPDTSRGGADLDPSNRGKVIKDAAHDYREPTHASKSGTVKTPGIQQKYTEPRLEAQVSSNASKDNSSDMTRGNVPDPLNRGDVTNENDIEKNQFRASQHSTTPVREVVVDKKSNLQDDISRRFSPLEVCNKLPVIVGKEANSYFVESGEMVHTSSPVMLAKEGGDGPDKRRTEAIACTVLPSLASGDVTANAGGDEDEESVKVSPSTSGVAVSKSDLPEPETNIADVENKVSIAENASIISKVEEDNEKNEKEEQSKEAPCLDVLAECMRKWGKPRCTSKYSYTPNLDPPCCRQSCPYPFPATNQKLGAEESKTDQDAKEVSKEESKAMKCTYTGFDDAKKSELEALIDKHVSYLRCTQGENAAVPKQTSFISSAPDPYSQMCKELAFKTSAGLFNQSINKDRYPCADIYAQMQENNRDPCPKLPPLCRPPTYCPDPCQPTCYRDPCPKLPKLCCTPPSCVKPCFPASCCTKLPTISRIPSCCIDPCSTFPRPNPHSSSKPCSPPQSSIDPCMDSFKPSSPPPYCADPCDLSCNPCSSRPRADPCFSMRQPRSPRSDCKEPCTGLSKFCSTPPCCIDPFTGLPKPISPRTSCIDPCSVYPKPCSPRPVCTDPSTGLPTFCNPLPVCIDPCIGVPKSCNSRTCCLDPRTGLSKPCSPPPSCIDSYRGLRKLCNRLPNPCVDPCTSIPMQHKACPSFPKQYRIDPITRLPILCCTNPCLDPCDKISSISCNSASDTKVSMFSSALSFCKEPQDSAPCRQRPCPPPCSGSYSFLGGKSGSISRRRSSSLDHFKSLRQRRAESQNLSRKIQFMESKWTGIKQKACEVMDQLKKLQEQECSPRAEPFLSPRANPCPSPNCSPCPSPIINPCLTPMCKPSPTYRPCPSPECSPYKSPICNPCTSPRFSSSKPLCENPQVLCYLCKRTPVSSENDNGMSSNFMKSNYPCVPIGDCSTTSRIKTTTVCCACDKQTSMISRSACNQTSEFGRRPSKCTTSCAQLNESSNKKFQVGSANNFAEISTSVGPSLMAPPPPRKRGRSEKKCTIMRIGKCQEGGQARDPNTNMDVSCCSTRAEGGKVAEIAKFVKECFDESAMSAAAGRPVVKIRYNKGGNHCSNPCEDVRLKEQIAKAIKKGKEVQKMNSDKCGKNLNGLRSRTVLRIKANKNSEENCEIYNVQLEDNNPTSGVVTKGSSRRRRDECLDGSNPEIKDNLNQQNVGVSPRQKILSTDKDIPTENKYPSSDADEMEGTNSREDLNRCHQEVVCPPDCESPYPGRYEADSRVLGSCNEHKQSRRSQANKIPTNVHVNVCLEEEYNTCLETHNQCFENSGPVRENSNVCTLESNSSCLQDNLPTSAPEREDHCCVEESNKIDMEHRHNFTQQGSVNTHSNTNENANSEQHENDKSSKTVAEQIPAALSGQKAYCHDLSKYDHGFKPNEEGLWDFACDVFLQSSESGLHNFKSPYNKDKHSKVQKPYSNATTLVQRDEANVKHVTHLNKVNDFWSPESRDIRKRCMYIDDPSWEAFEYIEKHVFSLPTSYPSRQETSLYPSLDNSLAHIVESKPIRKRHVFSKTLTRRCNTSYENSMESPQFVEKENISLLGQRKMLGNNCEQNKTGGLTKVASAFENSIKVQYNTRQISNVNRNELKLVSEKRVQYPCDSSDTISQNPSSGLSIHLNSEKPKTPQQGNRNTQICANISAQRGLNRISEEMNSVLNQSSLKSLSKLSEISDTMMVPTLTDVCNGGALKARGKTESTQLREYTTEHCLRTEGSEGSTHGIEDLPLDTESLSSHIKSLPSPKTPNYISQTSTSPSQNKEVYAGDYVEVCSSAPVQNRISSPKYSKLMQDKQIQIQHSFMQGQKECKTLKFEDVPLNGEVFYKTKHGKGICKEVHSQSEVFETRHGAPGRVTSSNFLQNSRSCNDQGGQINPARNNVIKFYQDASIDHGKEKLTFTRENRLSSSKQAPNAYGFTSNSEHSQKRLFSNVPRRRPDRKFCPKNTDVYEICVQPLRMVETPPKLNFNKQFHVFNSSLYDGIDMNEPWVDLKSQFFSKQRTVSCSSNELAKGEFLKPSKPLVTKYALDALTMTSQSINRDMATQVTNETRICPQSALEAQTMVHDDLDQLPGHSLHKDVLELYGVGDKDAWRTIRVGCAEVTQASQNRVVLQGAYVLQQSTPSHKNLAAGSVSVVPFQLIFLKTTGPDKSKLSIKGTYSRSDLDSPTGNVGIWDFQV